MSGSLNKAMVSGYLGKDPEIRSFQNGGRAASMSIATSESWKDKESGERKERTEWHRVSILSDGLVTVAEKYQVRLIDGACLKFLPDAPRVAALPKEPPAPARIGQVYGNFPRPVFRIDKRSGQLQHVVFTFGFCLYRVLDISVLPSFFGKYRVRVLL